MPDDERQPERSEPGLDAYRALVVLLMFAVHSRRIQTAYAKGLSDRALSFLMWLEPYIAASFLFIAGFSLVLSYERRRDGWLKKTSLRALGLVAISIGLFVPQYGLELPDLLVSSGILSAIAVAIALTAAALATGDDRADLVLATLGVGVLAATFALDRAELTVPGINGGPGGAFPLVAFSAAGALIARARRKRGSRVLLVAGGAAALASGLAIASGAPFTTDHFSMYRAHAGELALTSLFSDAPKLGVRFWNHSAAGALGLALPLVGSLAAFLALSSPLRRLRFASPLLLLGRHALAVYVLHLGLLGVVDLLGLQPTNARGTWLLIGAITLVALVAARVLESKSLTRFSAWLGKRRSTTRECDTSERRRFRPQI